MSLVVYLMGYKQGGMLILSGKGVSNLPSKKVERLPVRYSPYTSSRYGPLGSRAAPGTY